MIGESLGLGPGLKVKASIRARAKTRTSFMVRIGARTTMRASIMARINDQGRYSG